MVLKVKCTKCEGEYTTGELKEVAIADTRYRAIRGKARACPSCMNMVFFVIEAQSG